MLKTDKLNTESGKTLMEGNKSSNAVSQMAVSQKPSDKAPAKDEDDEDEDEDY